MPDTTFAEDVFLRIAGDPYRSAVGRIGTWAMEGELSDAMRGKVPAVVGAVAMLISFPLQAKVKEAGFDVKSWQVAEVGLKAARLVLREAQYRLDLPPSVLTPWSHAAGVALDAGWEGLVEGTISRANDYVRDAGRKIAIKVKERKEAGQPFTEQDRREAMGPDVYDAAKAIVSGKKVGKNASSKTDAKSDEPKTDKDGSRIEGMGKEMDIFTVFTKEEAKAKGDPTALLEIRAKRTVLEDLGGTHPKEATAITRASAHGLLPSGEVMRILGLPGDVFINDPRAPRDAPRRISVRTDALLQLAAAAEKRLKDAQPAKAETKDPDDVKKKGGEPGAHSLDPSLARHRHDWERRAKKEGIISLYSRTIPPWIKWLLVPLWGPIWLFWWIIRWAIRWLSA
jgi:hypothetical protein